MSGVRSEADVDCDVPGGSSQAIAHIGKNEFDRRLVPCVDGSVLARVF